jgi:tetratricopeptide (TPR) repeat protein
MRIRATSFFNVIWVNRFIFIPPKPRPPDLLPDAVRLLERAHRAEPTNFDTLVLLGNSHFELARAVDARAFGEARTAYEKALRLRPRDVQLSLIWG